MLKASDVVIVAVKPQYLTEVLVDMKPDVRQEHIIVSIAGGIPIEKILMSLGKDTRVVRVMPNTPCLVGETASAMCIGGKVRSVMCGFL